MYCYVLIPVYSYLMYIVLSTKLTLDHGLIKGANCVQTMAADSDLTQDITIENKDMCKKTKRLKWAWIGTTIFACNLICFETGQASSLRWYICRYILLI